MLISCVRPSLSMYQARQRGRQHGKHSTLLWRTFINLICRVFSWEPCLRTNLNCRNSKNKKPSFWNIYPSNKATHENTLFFPGGLLHWKLIVELIKRAQRILKKRAGPQFGARTTFLIIKQRIQDILGRKLLSFFFLNRVFLDYYCLYSKWLCAFAFLFCSFSFFAFSFLATLNRLL